MADSTYKSIAKANTLFGGVQVFNILISIVRSKLVAILLGPAGMGIMGLFQSSIDLVRSFTNMGLQTSAVRDVSLANKSGDTSEISATKTVVSRLVWITGMLGTLITYLGASYLSTMAFGNKDYTIHFQILSIILLINQLTVQHNVLLQGMRQLKKLAAANIIGSLVGLFINIPLFYFLGEQGIVPALIMVALSAYLVAWFNSRTLKIKKADISWKDTFLKGKNMLEMGLLIGLTGLMDMLIIYIVKVAIQNWGSVAEVGLYTAGFAIVQSYVNLIFGAISTDYYPRLCAASNNKEAYCEIGNKQFEIMILALTPLILFFIAFSPILLYILYSSEFEGIFLMVDWIAFGMILRAYSWCPGFLYLAKGDSKLYFVIYIVTFIYTLLFYLGGFKLWGLTGVGFAFPLGYLVGTGATLLIVYKRYGFVFSKTSNQFMLMATAAALSLLCVSYYVPSPYSYFINIPILIITTLYCYKQMDKRLDINGLLKKTFRNNG